MKKKNIFTLIAAVIIIILIFFLVFLSEKKLDIASEEVKKLHESLGDVDINKCGGLITYGDNSITLTDIDVENRLCRAYYDLKENQKKNQKTQSNEKNSDGTRICKVGESTTLATTDENETECAYNVIEISDLKESYGNIYGNTMNEEDKFYISDKEICIKEGEKYYCGNAETYKISITPEATIYRIINKAIKRLNGDIVVYDYFLKISNNACYSKNTNTENKECSDEIKEKELSKDEEVIEIVKKYGTIYKHTFKQNKNKNHYWEKTELN